jgi:ADP-heptose:LPS heptosyltransferase
VRCLLFLLPGLGDALVASPVIDGAIRAGWDLDVMTMLDPVARYARALHGIGDVEHFDLFAGQGGALPSVWRLRKRRYDVAVLPFPATRWQYHALALAAGAKHLATHDYGGVARVLDRLGRATLVPLAGGHRIAENARLARAVGLTPGALRYLVPQEWRAERIGGLLGIHPGSMRYKGNEHKRWPLEDFGALIRANLARGRRVRVFIGPAEREDSAALAALAGPGAIEFVDRTLEEAARSLSECEVFVGNDAGFAQLAAGLGVKTISLFGMTDTVRGQPVGPSIALRPSDCPACHDEGMRTFACVRHIEYRCIRADMTVDVAARAVDTAFSSDIPAFVPAETGDFRLYGRRMTTMAIKTIDPINQKIADASDAASGS